MKDQEQVEILYLFLMSNTNTNHQAGGGGGFISLKSAFHWYVISQTRVFLSPLYKLRVSSFRRQLIELSSSSSSSSSFEVAAPGIPEDFSH